MITIRFSRPEDAPYLTKWLNEPGVLRWFPMREDEREIEDAVRNWIGYSKYGAGLTAEWNNVPCGMANLYLQPFKKLSHQCLFGILVSEEYRGKGVGTRLLEELMKVAKEKFNIEILHLEVYDGNPAQRLYERLGFTEFGRQTHFIKEDGEYRGKVLMQRTL